MKGNNKLWEWAAAELHNSSIHFPGQQAKIKYISLPFFQRCMCVLGVRFLSSLFFILRKNTILEKFSLTIAASGGSFCSGWELQTRSLRLFGSGDAGFSASNFYGIYTCISHIWRCFFQWWQNGNGPLCPFASVLGRSANVSRQHRLCLLGLRLGMSGCERRGKRDQNKREQEERGKSRHELAEEQQRAACIK